MSGKEAVDYDDIRVQAPLTSQPAPSEPLIRYKFGRKVIKIPLEEESVDEITIKRYLPLILMKHSKNRCDCEHFEKVYRGKTNIFEKIRKINPEKKNSIVSENHANYMVEFKKGYMFGNPLKYSLIDDSSSSDDLTFLNKYALNQKKAAKDIELGEAVFKCGNAYRMILPKPYGKVTNLLKESPFEIINLDNKATFVVYSSSFKKNKLFAGIITTIDSPNPNDISYEIMIYTKTHSYRYKCYSITPTFEGTNFISKKRHYLDYIPIVEYYTNTARLGVVEITETILDAVNDVSSDSVDNINDFVNSILAIYNMEIDKDSKKQIDENQAISLKTNDPSRPADAKYLTNALQQSDVMTKYEQLVKVAYNVVGVPQPTTKTTSGGDTGDARELGGGWENANIIAKQNEEPLKQGEYMCLEIMLNICRKTPNCPVNELYPSDIAINFNRTNRNNLLVKTQSLQTLISMNMPKEIALNIVELTSNTHEVALAWESEIEKARQIAIENSVFEQQDNKENMKK